MKAAFTQATLAWLESLGWTIAHGPGSPLTVADALYVAEATGGGGTDRWNSLMTQIRMTRRSSYDH